MLPAIFSFEQKNDKIKYLKSYVSTYVKLEIQMEQLLRKLDPFRSFLEISAQMNGKPLNFSKISREVGADTKTIINYYQILEETYLGFSLPAYHTSLRKSLLLTPKFYFFDIGVKRALEHSLQSEVDLVLTRGKKEIIFIEIKSSRYVGPVEVKKIANLTSLTSIKKYYLSQDPKSQSYHGVRCLFWKDGINEIFSIDSWLEII